MKKRTARYERVDSREFRFTVLFAPVEGGGYQVLVPLLPGLVTYGRTLPEARTLARDAIRCHLDGLLKAGETIPNEGKAHAERLRVALSA